MLLALESSCDETAAAICTAEGDILASAVASQIEIHRQFGGVVPEVASRNHILHVQPLVETVLAQAGLKLTDITAFAATSGPGLVSSLLIGTSMGGWGTLRYANLLANVGRVLAFVPRRPPPHLDERLLQVRSNAQAEYCIMYGELEDENSKQIVAENFAAPNASIMEVINCGHNLATYLHSISLLPSVLKAAIHSTTMGADIRRIVSSIRPDEKTKQRRMARNKPSAPVAEWYFL